MQQPQRESYDVYTCKVLLICSLYRRASVCIAEIHSHEHEINTRQRHARGLDFICGCFYGGRQNRVVLMRAHKIFAHARDAYKIWTMTKIEVVSSGFQPLLQDARAREHGRARTHETRTCAVVRTTSRATKPARPLFEIVILYTRVASASFFTLARVATFIPLACTGRCWRQRWGEVWGDGDDCVLVVLVAVMMMVVWWYGVATGFVHMLCAEQSEQRPTNRWGIIVKVCLCCRETLWQSEAIRRYQPRFRCVYYAILLRLRWSCEACALLTLSRHVCVRKCGLMEFETKPCQRCCAFQYVCTE